MCMSWQIVIQDDEAKKDRRPHRSESHASHRVPQVLPHTKLRLMIHVSRITTGFVDMRGLAIRLGLSGRPTICQKY